MRRIYIHEVNDECRYFIDKATMDKKFAGAARLEIENTYETITFGVNIC